MRDGRNSNEKVYRKTRFIVGFKDSRKYSAKYVTWQNRGNTLAQEGKSLAEALAIFEKEWPERKAINLRDYGVLNPYDKRGRVRRDLL